MNKRIGKLGLGLLGLRLTMRRHISIGKPILNLHREFSTYAKNERERNSAEQREKKNGWRGDPEHEKDQEEDGESQSKKDGVFLDDPANVDTYYNEIKPFLPIFKRISEMEAELLYLPDKNARIRLAGQIADYSQRNGLKEEASFYRRYQKSLKFEAPLQILKMMAILGWSIFITALLDKHFGIFQSKEPEKVGTDTRFSDVLVT